VSISNFILRVIRFREIQNRDRNIQNERLYKPARLTVVPNIFTLNIWEMKQTALSLLNESLEDKSTG
jgi:hypothetical protein